VTPPHGGESRPCRGPGARQPWAGSASCQPRPGTWPAGQTGPG